jgi:penicillin-binding protein 3
MAAFGKRADKHSRGKIDKIIRNRAFIFGGIILMVFMVIFVRLVYIQAFSREEYEEKTEDYTSIRQYTSAPRGQIYDCNGKLLAQTVVSHNIVYTSPLDMTYDDYELYAKRVVEVFDVQVDDFSYHDQQEAYITYKGFLDSSDPEYNALHLLTDEEYEEYVNGEWGDDEDTILYAKQISRIGTDQINSIPENDLKVCLVYQRMLAYVSTGQENVILEDVSDDDIAYLVEHKTEFPGFDVDFGGWKRVYPYGDTLSDILGSVTTTTEGLPDSYADEYLAQGYQYNASVGRSGLELQYNDLLAGTQEVAKITYNSEGVAEKEVLQKAKCGYDIHLSIDIDLQQEVDEIVKTTLEQNAGTSLRENFTTLFFSMMDPNTGEIKAMSGYQIDLDTRGMTYFASGNYVTLVNPGSCIKGVTVYMGLSEGAVTASTTIDDSPLNIAGQEFASYTNHGTVDAVTALSVSSNVYMFRLAISLAGATYEEGQALDIPDLMGTFDLMRSYYSMFGLGNPTGLDIPNESGGYMGVVTEAGMLLNYSIGQFDMYTPIQLLQYISVVAADGKMYQPHFYTYANEVNSQQIVDVNAPTLKSVLDDKNSANLDVVQSGFRACVADGNCGSALQSSSVQISAKTGTAEVGEWTTANLVGYAPSENPDIAFACVSPTSSVNDEDLAYNICSTTVTPQVLEKYFELYPE